MSQQLRLAIAVSYYKLPKSHQVENPSRVGREDSDSLNPMFSGSTKCEGSVQSHGVLSMRLSAGATNLSCRAVLAGEGGTEVGDDICGGICAARPPSAVFTVTSGDMATITSRVEADPSSMLSRETGGARDGCSNPSLDVPCDSGVQLTCRTSHISGMLRWILDGSQSSSMVSDPAAIWVILSSVRSYSRQPCPSCF